MFNVHDRVRCAHPNDDLPNADELRDELGTVTYVNDARTIVDVRFDKGNLSITMNADELELVT